MEPPVPRTSKAGSRRAADPGARAAPASTSNRAIASRPTPCHLFVGGRREGRGSGNEDGPAGELSALQVLQRLRRVGEVEAVDVHVDVALLREGDDLLEVA